MPKLRSGEEWAKSLRQDIKTEIGLGWNVCGHKRSDGTLSGSCKLTHRTIERMQRKFGKDCERERSVPQWADKVFLKRFCTPYGM